MTRAGFGVDRIDRQEITWQQFVSLTDGFMSDHTSHTFASAAEWSYVPSAEEVFFYNELDVKAMMNRGKNQPKAQPVKRPWEQPRESASQRPDPEHEARLERLQKRLGLPAS